MDFLVRSTEESERERVRERDRALLLGTKL